MKTKSILLLIGVFCFLFSANAQNGTRGFDLEAIKKEKAEFLKKEMNLTDAEIKAFLPLEAEFTQKKFEINREARRETRELRRKENKTEADYQKITQLNLESEQRSTQLQAKYYKKFSQVLSAEKVERYRNADQKFNERLLKEHQQRRSSGGR
jgi:Spy/CpxP family protein refolding chaperone